VCLQNRKKVIGMPGSSGTRPDCQLHHQRAVHAQRSASLHIQTAVAKQSLDEVVVGVYQPYVDLGILWTPSN